MLVVVGDCAGGSIQHLLLDGVETVGEDLLELKELGVRGWRWAGGFVSLSDGVGEVLLEREDGVGGCLTVCEEFFRG